MSSEQPTQPTVSGAIANTKIQSAMMIHAKSARDRLEAMKRLEEQLKADSPSPSPSVSQRGKPK